MSAGPAWKLPSPAYENEPQRHTFLGAAIDVAPIGELAGEDFERVIRISLSAVFYCMKHEIEQVLTHWGVGHRERIRCSSMAATWRSRSPADCRHGSRARTAACCLGTLVALCQRL